MNPATLNILFEIIKKANDLQRRYTACNLTIEENEVLQILAKQYQMQNTAVFMEAIKKLEPNDLHDTIINEYLIIMPLIEKEPNKGNQRERICN